jgi:hypothetical protein
VGGVRAHDQQHEVIRGRFHAVNKDLGRRGVRFMFGRNLGSTPVGRDWTHGACSPGCSATRRDPGFVSLDLQRRPAATAPLTTGSGSPTISACEGWTAW